MVNNELYERHKSNSSFELITACCRLGNCEGTFSVIESSSHLNETMMLEYNRFVGFCKTTVAECEINFVVSD